MFAPTHPGWEGTERPTDLTSVTQLANDCLELLAADGAQLRARGGVALVGSSIGGWIALEMAVRGACDPRFEGLVDRVVVIDSVGSRWRGSRSPTSSR